MHAPRDIMHVIAPSKDPQNAQINADIILTEERTSQKVLLFSNFILLPDKKRLVSTILHILCLKDS